MDFNFKNKYVPTVIVAIILIAVAFYIGMSYGEGKSALPAHSDLTSTDIVTQDQFAPFWKAWQALNDKDLSAASTSVQDKIWGSIQGLASSYKDPYTVFFPPVENKMFNDDIAGDFEGVGMEIGIKNSQLVVVAPLKGSPAEAAGVKSGDAILKIDATSTKE